MPEGPEVRIFADQLRSILVGKTLLCVNFDKRSRYFTSTLPNYTEFVLRLPATITSVRSVGKKIRFDFSNGTGAISSLGMEGKWVPEPGSASNLWLVYTDSDSSESESSDQLASTDVWRQRLGALAIDPKREKLRNGESVIYFDDTRHFGTFQVFLSEAATTNGLGHLGPDLLEIDVDFKQWKAVFGNPRRKNVIIGMALLEQKYFSGIGNYLRAEILYAAKINPLRTLESLSDDDLESIRSQAIRIIRDAYQSRGCTLWTYVDMNGEMGQYSCVVYGHTADPDGNPVVRDTLGDKRTIWWVPAVQV